MLREPSNILMNATSVLRAEGYSKNENQKTEYPNVPSALRPVSHGEDLPTTPLNWKDNNILEMSDIENTSDENIDISEKICCLLLE
ncbi:hypothetical protein AVEN_167894-1 [Araneus ventricosus]|uniref:Uncharacterized protein n=1 Tax=Araneus ventricosus TaxID=182803 RepID=A0A4Y2ITM0_ARAVE|nr:hypothetical protein AVEN_167894-1 [Araneus ventricosus]